MVENALLYKIIIIGVPKYLTDFIPKREVGYNSNRNGNEPFFNCRTESFKNSFSPYFIKIEAWYSSDLTIINSRSLEVLSKLLAFI